MMSEEDKKLAIEAKGCSTCLEWHHHCQSECCKTVNLNTTDPDEFNKSGSYFIFKQPVSPSMQYYYKLHGIDYVHGILRIKKDRCRIIDRQVIYIHSCSLLEGLLCKGHPNNKPLICKALTLETAPVAIERGIVLTSNCLFKYKNMEVDDGVKENQN